MLGRYAFAYAETIPAKPMLLKFATTQPGGRPMRAHLLTSLAFFLAFIVPAAAGPGHDHGDGGHESAPAHFAEVPRLESAGVEIELVATAKGHTLTIFLDRLATNEPVDGATIEVSGDGISPVTAEPKGNGTYTLDTGWADMPGAKALNFVVTKDGKTDLLNGILDIPETTAEAAPKPVQVMDLLREPAMWMLAALAAVLGFAFSFAFRPLRLPADVPQAKHEASTHTSTHASFKLKDAAEVIVAVCFSTILLVTDVQAGGDHEGGHGHGGSASIQAGGETPRKLPEGEVFLPKASQRLLRVRTLIAETAKAQSGAELVGTVIANPALESRVQAPLDGLIELGPDGVPFVGKSVKAGEVLAVLSPSISVFDRGSLQQATAEVEGKLRIAEQKLARLSKISDVVAKREIDETKFEVESLREQKKALVPKNSEKIQLKAPLNGTISVANIRAGQVVTARDTLFEIVDPQNLWIEGIGKFEHDDIAISAAFALDAEGHSIPLTFVGQAPALRQQSMALHFKINEAHSSLAIGASVKVILQRGEAVDGLVLPGAAVVRGTNGLPQVWEKVSAERFRALPVRTKPIDGARVLILSGVELGSRIVTGGAEYINQVR